MFSSTLWLQHFVEIPDMKIVRDSQAATERSNVNDALLCALTDIANNKLMVSSKIWGQ